MPVQRPVAIGGQPDFSAEIGLFANLILGAVTGRRTIGTESGPIGRIENERDRVVANECRRVERVAGQHRGRRETAVGCRHRCRRRTREGVAGEICRRAVCSKRLVDVTVQRPGSQRHRLKFMRQLDGCFERGLVIGRTDVRIVVEFVRVHVFKKGRVHTGKIGKMERRIKIDRGAGQVGIACLEIDFGRIAQLCYKPAIDRPCFLIIDHFCIVQEPVPVKAVAGVVGTGQHQAGAIADRRRDIGRGLVGIVFCRADLDAAFQHITGLQRLDDDRAGRCVAAVQRALRAFQYFDLAQGALILVELGGVGLENAVDDQRHRAFGIARAVDAANVDLGITGFGGAADNGHAGGQLDKFIGLLDTGPVEHVLGEHGDRCRHVGQQFVLPAGGDDDHIGIVAFAGFLFAADLSQRGVETDQRGKAG